MQSFEHKKVNRLKARFRPASGCVAQLVERSFPIPEVHGLNPVIGKIYLY